MKVSKNEIDLMKTLLVSKEVKLFNSLSNLLSKNYNYKVVKSDNFLYAKGKIPIGIIAHVDTVYKEPPNIIFHDVDLKAMWSPLGLGADDRAGVFAILKLLQKGYRPTVIITRGEEKGGIGAYELISKMPKNDSLKFLIQLDRSGFNDAVFYDCDNKEFEKYITGFGFNTEFGTFTDISIIAPVWGIAAVNLSVGYLNEHSDIEHWFYDSCYETIEKVGWILDDVAINSVHRFKYIPCKKRKWSFYAEQNAGTV
jgi:hypothetical protein